MNSTAIGRQTNAASPDSTVVGYGATAGNNSATAIGKNATTTKANQVMLGGTGSNIAIGDIAASDAAQTGAEQVVTIDSAGTLGVSNMATSASVDNLRSAMNHIAAVSDAQFDALTGRVGGIESRLDGFDLRMEGLEGGIASAMALGGAMPVPGKAITLTVAGGTYGGEQAFAGMVTGRVTDAIYISAGVTGNTADDRVGGRVAASFGF